MCLAKSVCKNVKDNHRISFFYSMLKIIFGLGNNISAEEYNFILTSIFILDFH